jgi:hypothetical protein
VGSDPECDNGAVAGNYISINVENLNFSGCYANSEGTAFSMERQNSRLRFVSVGNTPGGSSAVDFDDEEDGKQ